jgi:hypothetical protein
MVGAVDGEQIRRCSHPLVANNHARRTGAIPASKLAEY